MYLTVAECEELIELTNERFYATRSEEEQKLIRKTQAELWNEILKRHTEEFGDDFDVCFYAFIRFISQFCPAGEDLSRWRLLKIDVSQFAENNSFDVDVRDDVLEYNMSIRVEFTKTKRGDNIYSFVNIDPDNNDFDLSDMCEQMYNNGMISLHTFLWIRYGLSFCG